MARERLIDPAEKRAEIERLKSLIGRERITPTKRQGFTEKQRAAVFAAFEGKCAACGMSVRRQDAEIDHITQRWRGGKHRMENWQLLCVGCHQAKTSREATENGKIRRLEERELNGPKPATLKSGRKLQSRGFDKTKTRTMRGEVRSRK